MLDLTSVELPVFPSPDAAPFWDGVARAELLLPRCEACAAVFWYPRTMCPTCGSRAIDWVPESGLGNVHAFCIHHSSALAFVKALAPVVTVLVDLEEGPRMMGFLDAEPDPATIKCGMAVGTRFTETADGTRVPVFVPNQEDQ